MSSHEWISTVDFVDRTLTVRPILDWTAHEESSTGCVCGPQFSEFIDHDGHFWNEIVHEALDGRL